MVSRTSQTVCSQVVTFPRVHTAQEVAKAFPEHSCLFLSKRNPLRIACIRMVTWKLFELRCDQLERQQQRQKCGPPTSLPGFIPAQYAGPDRCQLCDPGTRKQQVSG